MFIRAVCIHCEVNKLQLSNSSCIDKFLLKLISCLLLWLTFSDVLDSKYDRIWCFFQNPSDT